MIVNYTIKLKDKDTNEVKEVVYEYTYNKDKDYETIEEFDVFVEFEWVENNMSCDCNRYIKFYPESEIDYPCSSVSNERFDILEIKRDNKVIWEKGLNG